MEKFFKLKENNTTVRTEIMAGLTTFFAMAYIVFVNPNQVAAEGANGWLAAIGADGAALGQIWNAVYIASILGAIVGTLLMALYAKLPFALYLLRIRSILRRGRRYYRLSFRSCYHFLIRYYFPAFKCNRFKRIHCKGYA